MKTFIYSLLLCSVFLSCNSAGKVVNSSDNSNALISDDTVRIANDDIQYEIIIIEPGFSSWLASIAKPEGYYTQSFMEGRNRLYVSEWNNRVLQPFRFNPNLYEMRIDYDYGVDYGYEVNYKLYNYFIYFQLTHNQQLAGYVPRI